MRHARATLHALAFLAALCCTACQTSPTLDPSTARSQATPPYWVAASSGKTHNSSCRYFMKSKGRMSVYGSGKNCKICGGTVR